jgi:hypothetical protein
LAKKNTHAVQSAEHHIDKYYGEEIHRSIIRSNEKEISHGRVRRQSRWTYFGMVPLASSIG